jgi:hypothetical protein
MGKWRRHSITETGLVQDGGLFNASQNLSKAHPENYERRIGNGIPILFGAGWESFL